MFLMLQRILTRLGGMGKWDSPYAIGAREGIEMRVDFYPDAHPKYSGKISTAYPLNAPQNPPRGWKLMELKLLDLIKECEEKLDKESVDEVMHFYNHGEYEMALEGLIIEMIKVQKYPKSYTIDILNELVLYYRLNIESVFD